MDKHIDLQPYFSLIVPAFNAKDTLEHCVNSVLKQSFDNYELIIVDDGSSDETLEICRKLASADSRIVIMHQENKGVSAARNTGLQIAKGTVVGFLDADDTLEVVALEHVKKCFEEHDVSVVLINYFKKNDNNLIKIDNYAGLKGLQSASELGSRCLKVDDRPMLSSACLMYVNRRHLLDVNIWFPGDMTISEDLVFCYNIFKSTSTVFVLDENLYCYVSTPGSATRKYNPKQEYCVDKILALFSVHHEANSLIDAYQMTSCFYLSKNLFLPGNCFSRDSERLSELKRLRRKYSLRPARLLKSKSLMGKIRWFACCVLSISPRVFSMVAGKVV